MNQLLLSLVLVVVFSGKSLAQLDTTSAQPKLNAGSIELGFSGSITEVEGSLRTTIALRGGTFYKIADGFGGAEFEIGYTHIQSLDVLDFQTNISYTRKWWDAPIYPFIAITGGLRQEWLGSFQQARYSAGSILGARLMVTNQVAFRCDFSICRFLNEQVKNFTEKRIKSGVSILIRN